MGYATVMRVPRIQTYAQALRKYNITSPIAGRNVEIRPLGERRDVDTYSIRKNVWTDTIELVLYQTPVIKFKVDDEVVIGFGRWSSASTCQFISRVLGIGAGRVRGDVVLSFANGSKAVIADNEELVLVRGGDGRWQPKQKQTLYDYRVNRKEANNVRKQVSQFKDYLSGVVKLKAETLVQNFGPSFQIEHHVVRVTYAELFEVFGKEGEACIGEEHSGRFRPNVSKWLGMAKKPKHWRPVEGAKEKAWQEYREMTKKFYDLIRNDQDDNCRHQNYWIAFNILLVQDQQLWWRDSADYWVTLGVDEFEKHLNKILFTMFADRVFKKVELAEGKVPTGKYDDYLRSEDD